MILGFFLTLAFTQIAVGQVQEISQQQPIIQAGSDVSPCLECLRNSEMDFPPQYESSVCRCGLEKEEGDLGESGGCCCCSTDNFQSNDNADKPSFSIAMLAPLASIITSFMQGVGNNAEEQPVTFNFDEQTCSSEDNEEYPLGPQCEAPPYANETVNVSISTSPPSTPTATLVSTKSKAVGCQCRRKARKGPREESDIEEDSLYAIIQKPAKTCSCNSPNQEASSVRVPSCNCISSNVERNRRIYSRNDIHQPSFSNRVSARNSEKKYRQFFI